MALITQADLEAKLGRSLTASETTNFAILNSAIQTQVERLINTNVESVSESVRYYDGGVQNLAIAPCTDITAVKYYDEDENIVDTVDASDYVKYPRNATLKTMLINRYGKFQSGYITVGVTAKHSIYEDSDMLALVKDAILDVLANEIEDSGNIQKESIEGYSVEFKTNESKEVMQRLASFFQTII